MGYGMEVWVCNLCGNASRDAWRVGKAFVCWACKRLTWEKVGPIRRMQCAGCGKEEKVGEEFASFNGYYYCWRHVPAVRGAGTYPSQLGVFHGRWWGAASGPRCAQGEHCFCTKIGGDHRGCCMCYVRHYERELS